MLARGCASSGASSVAANTAASFSWRQSRSGRCFCPALSKSWGLSTTAATRSATTTCSWSCSNMALTRPTKTIALRVGSHSLSACPIAPFEACAISGRHRELMKCTTSTVRSSLKSRFSSTRVWKYAWSMLCKLLPDGMMLSLYQMQNFRKEMELHYHDANRMGWKQTFSGFATDIQELLPVHTLSNMMRFVCGFELGLWITFTSTTSLWWTHLQVAICLQYVIVGNNGNNR